MAMRSFNKTVIQSMRCFSTQRVHQQRWNWRRIMGGSGDEKGTHSSDPGHNRTALANARCITEKIRELAMAEKNVDEAERHVRNLNVEISKIDHTQYEYPFNNVVFEGGGAKGIVYVGALEVLEEVGIKPKRYAGASAGAMVAALAAVGYDSKQISEVLQRDLEKILVDHGYGYLSLVPNMLRKFGWNPGDTILDFFGELLADTEKTSAKFGPDVTFLELFEATGTELCVVAVNVNMMRADYFHPKTTPDVPIRFAVRMSMSIPGFFQPVLRNESSTEEPDYYVDGGVLCNFPIHAYDGWWLSMAEKDTFLNRLHPLRNFSKLYEKRFEPRSDDTLGFMVYSSKEQDFLRPKLERRVGLKIEDSDRPNTKLARKGQEHFQSKHDAEVEHDIYMDAMDRFRKAVRESEEDIEDLQTKEGFIRFMAEVPKKVAINDFRPEETEFNTEDCRILFGDDYDPATIFDEVDVHKHGKFRTVDLRQYVSQRGFNINTRYSGHDRKSIQRVSQFFNALTNGWMSNTTERYLKVDDYWRTVGINCDYISTMDFSLEQEDVKFAKSRGAKSTISFLKHYVYEKGDKVKKKTPV